MVLVDSKYFPNMVSTTASFVDRARPDEKAIFAKVVSTLELNNRSVNCLAEYNP